MAYPDIFHEVVQVDDQPAVLDAMYQELRQTPALYAPTNYWEHYERIFLPELKARGLRDFRRRRDSILRSFGATDLFPYAEIVSYLNPVADGKAPTFKGRIGSLLTRLINSVPGIHLSIDGVSGKEWPEYLYWRLQPLFAAKGLDLDSVPASLVGNPEGTRRINGNLWTAAHAQQCLTFINAIRNVDMVEDGVTLDLGAGMGRIIEIIAALYPKMTLFAVEIPPQLYVCNQFMKKRFPDRVVPFEEAMTLDLAGCTEVPDHLRGKIVILPTSRMPMLSSLKLNLFWNSACFQEMEPPIVENYLDLVKGMRTDVVYINAMPGGNYWGEWKPGRGGTKERVREEIYKNALADGYSLEEEYYTDLFGRHPYYKSYLFKRK